MRAAAVMAIIGASVALLLGVIGGVGERVEDCRWVPNVAREASFVELRGGVRMVREAHVVDVLVCRDGGTLIRRR